MKKCFYFLSLLAATAALNACSSNDEAVASGEDGGIVDGTAYMKVNISLPTGSSTRAAADGGYIDATSTDNEYKVSSAKFLFFNSDGSYLTEGKELTNSISQSEDVETGDNTDADAAFIESKVGATVVLGPTTIKPNTTIKMLTFLNFKDENNGTTWEGLKNKSLDEVLKMTETSGNRVTDRYVMTTSAYVGGTEANNNSEGEVLRYTKVPSSYFKTSSTEATTNSVDVYVERTVAKIEMTVDANSATETLSEIAYNKAYKVKQTGTSNPEKYDYYFLMQEAPASTSTSATTRDYTLDGKLVNFAVKVSGWRANAINEKGYLIKNIQNTAYNYVECNETTGKPKDLSSNLNPVKDWQVNANSSGSTVAEKNYYWNNYGNYRSFWAEDVNYPTSETSIASNAIVPGDGVSGAANALKYYKASEVTTQTSEYIYENTINQKVAKFRGGDDANVTTMLIVGQVGTWAPPASDATAANSFTAKDLYRIQGAFYTETGFKEIVLAELNKTYCTLSSSNEETDLTSSDITIENEPCTGTTYTSLEKIGNITLKIKNADGKTIYTRKTTSSNSNSKVDNEILITSLLSGGISYYKNGYCYYQVPIEHPVYGAPSSSNTATTDATIYGVVRNHSYVLTLNSIGNLGNPINNPDEPIKPIPGEDTYYYLGTQCKVLAWRKATQTVNL